MSGRRDDFGDAFLAEVAATTDLHAESREAGATRVVAPVYVLARVDVVYPETHEIDAVEADPAGGDLADGRIWDDAPDGLGRVKIAQVLDLPVPGELVDVRRAVDGDGAAFFWAQTRRQPVLARVTAANVEAGTLSASEVDPADDLRANGRSFDGVRVFTAALPPVGGVVSLGYGFVGSSGTAEWYVIGAGAPATLTVRVDSSGDGQINWTALVPGTFAVAADAATGTANLPNGWLEVVSGTVVEVKPTLAEGGYQLVGGLRGAKADSPFDQAFPAGTNDESIWDVDAQGEDTGLDSHQLGPIRVGGSGDKEMEIFMWTCTHSAEGHLTRRERLQTIRLFGDGDPATALIGSGHVVFDINDDDFGNPTFNVTLTEPGGTLGAQRTITFGTGDEASELEFDNSGRLIGTGDITLDVGGLPEGTNGHYLRLVDGEPTWDILRAV